MTNKLIARYLKETGSLIELTGGNPFRARAFTNAARTIERTEDQVVDLLEDGTLTEIRGIGAALADQIQELVSTGSFELREQLIGSIPPGVLEMLRVKGIGAKKARTIWKTLDITSIDELEQAAAIGRLAELPGFGEKTQEKVLAAVQTYRAYSSARRYATAHQEATPVLETLRSIDGVARAEFSGAMRRRLEVVSSVDVLVAGDAEVVVPALIDRLGGEAQEIDGSTILNHTLVDGLVMRIKIVPPAAFGSEWWRDTGSAQHVEQFLAEFGEPADASDEATVFAAAGLPFIAPELREGDGELEAARTRQLPELIVVDDLKGSLHNHSTYSDGAHSLEQMADAARAMGLTYFGICDHSQSLTIANGLTIDRVLQQQEEIRSLNTRYEAEGVDFRIFSGIESDILVDGSLDYPEEILASFDLIVASIHSRFNMTREEATQRLITAVENPYTSILGHMTGRLLLTRDGYPVDHAKVIDACAENGVAIELNSNPHRLDMDWRWVKHALDRGVLISINPDAHSIDELRYVRWGVAVARKGWLTPDRCLNAMPREQFAAWVADRKAHASA